MKKKKKKEEQGGFSYVMEETLSLIVAFESGPLSVSVGMSCRSF